MTLATFVQSVAKSASRNSPTILTAISIVGIATTGILATRAAFQAANDATAVYVRTAEYPTNKEIAKASWKYFIPAAGVGLVTAGCIVGAHGIHLRRNALLLSAYTVSEKLATQYQDAVLDVVGPKTETEIRHKAAETRIAETPNNNVVMVGSSKVLCFETYTGRYFESDMETIRRAENDVNLLAINSHGEATLNEFFTRIGLARVPTGDEVGWNTDAPLEVIYSSQIHDGAPAIVIDYRNIPRYNFAAPW